MHVYRSVTGFKDGALLVLILSLPGTAKYRSKCGEERGNPKMNRKATATNGYSSAGAIFGPDV
jgi:hypothetical protein